MTDGSMWRRCSACKNPIELDGVEIEMPSHGYVSRQRDIAIVPIEWEGPTLPLSQSLSFDEVSIGQAVTVMGNADGARVASRRAHGRP